MAVSSRVQIAVVAAVLMMFLFVLNLRTSTLDLSYSLSHGSVNSKSKNAFCTFLAEPNDAIKDHQEDYYFMGTRMLAYQLLHDPETKTNNSIPFVVLVTENVPQWKRDRLILDGASVVEVGEIKIDWIKPGRLRWMHVMDKLHVFELTQFDKVLLFDGDVVVTRRLDPLFDEVDVLLNKGINSKVKDDEAPQPSQYLMAGNSGPGEKHDYPAPRGDRLNAGFVVFKPSIEMYQYYMSIAQIEGRFPGGSPEQDLWNYAHRKDGNMPWVQIDPDWTINSPNYNDYEHGIATLHEKYWRCHDKKLRDILLRSRWKTEGFFNSYDKGRSSRYPK